MVDKLYESENFLVVNKPFDMYINSDDENEKNTVTCHIASPDSHLASSGSPLHFVQRLDYSTSGVLCIAKNKNAAARACKLFEKRETSKYYLAIVRGHLEFELGDIMYDVGESLDASGHRMCAVNSSESACTAPRAAHTRVLLLETGSFMRDPVSVVLLKPVTGRRHQLRVHCAAAAHTVLGDYTYSRRQDTLPRRMFLHATRLVLPLQSEPLDIQTSEPFFSHPQLTSHYRPERSLYKFRTRDEFRKACDVIDTSYLIGVKYKRFCL